MLNVNISYYVLYIIITTQVLLIIAMLNLVCRQVQYSLEMSTVKRLQ